MPGLQTTAKQTSDWHNTDVKPEQYDTQKEDNFKAICKMLYFKRNGEQIHMRDLLGFSSLLPGVHTPAAKLWAECFPTLPRH